ncbi:RNA methyltransferase [Candidatus Kaiserbacteria bacterium]|nr:RNA methyltransferase [Candidatus Kaiserbacteria bacterium]
MHHIEVLLHNIRSAHNVGSVFRTADAAGVARVHLSGYTPRPVDRFGRVSKEIAKTALGAEASVLWRYRANPQAVIADARARGLCVVGIEQDARAVDYRTYTAAGPLLLLVGNEVRGLSPALRDACDMLVEIPQYGSKESLNVSVAAGVVLFRLV